jgi:cytochrome c biogenesis protein ResB
MLVALLAIVQFGAQTGGALIKEMFAAYRNVAETQAAAERAQRHQEHVESLEVQRQTARAIEKLADEVRTNSETVRRAVWTKGGAGEGKKPR